MTAPPSPPPFAAPPRVLHVLSTPRAEGTPHLVLDWLHADRHVAQDVLVLHRDPADLTDRLRAGADRYREHDLLNEPRRRKFPGVASVTRAAVRDWAPDAVICWNTGFGPWVCGGARAGGCRRLLVHAGNPAKVGLKEDWRSRYMTLPIAALGGTVVCCSDYVRDSLRRVPGVPDGRIQTVYNCSRAAAVADRAGAVRSARAGSAGSGGPPTAVMVATLEDHKDHATLLRAVPRVLAGRPDFRLSLVGGGSLRAEMERLAGELNLGDAVRFEGTCTDVPERLGAADLFVLSTTPLEGLGSVLLEALAAGLPVVATDVPACRETLVGGRWGDLVPPHDPAALADAILARLNAPADPAARTAAAHYAAGFTPERMLDAYFALAGLPPAGPRSASQPPRRAEA